MIAELLGMLTGSFILVGIITRLIMWLLFYFKTSKLQSAIISFVGTIIIIAIIPIYDLQNYLIALVAFLIYDLRHYLFKK